MDAQLVLDWNARPKRVRKPPPLTYWDEYVAKDPWYVRELIADVPPEELDAALFDEDFDDDGNSGSEVDVVEEDVDYSETETEDDGGDTESEGSLELDGSINSELSEDLGTDDTSSPIASDSASSSGVEGEPGSERQDGSGARGT